MRQQRDAMAVLDGISLEKHVQSRPEAEPPRSTGKPERPVITVSVKSRDFVNECVAGARRRGTTLSQMIRDYLEREFG